MTSALSNPYELKINGLTCKTSPYGQGVLILAEDMDKLGDKADQFRNNLYRLYKVAKSVNPKTKLLESVTVYGLKQPEWEK
jgi:hypothetical protein